jgi:hypothetical protein
VRADALDEALADGGGREARHLEGFVGSHWLGAVRGTGPVVLEPTVSAAPVQGAYGAVGLARNEGDHELPAIEVTARLFDDAGVELATATATSPIRGVRPGEPVPFTLVTSVPNDTVASVEWSAAPVATAAATSRRLAWTSWWERPAGGEPVELYLYRDPAGPTPYLLFGSVENVGDASVRSPEVVVAWLDAAGRVVTTTGAPVRDPDGRPEAALDAGGAGDALVAVTGGVPAGAEVLVWMQGS